MGNGHVLVLNRNLLAIAVTDWKRAMGLLYLDRAIVVDESWRTYDFGDWLDESERLNGHAAGYIRTPKLKIAVPEVIALKIFGKVPKREVTFNRRNVYHHYGYRCAYCGHEFPSHELNLDHVVPRSRGGQTDWTNVVPSCFACNKKKGSRLPAEAGMKLEYKPGRPKPLCGSLLWSRYPAALRRAWRRFFDPPKTGNA